MDRVLTYLDMSQVNHGGFRPQEYVDSEYSNSEGATIGWIGGGEWLENTVLK